MLRRVLAILVALLVAALGLDACASADTGASTAGPPTISQPMQITAVTVVDARHVRITAQVPAPTRTCVRHLTGRVTDTDRRSVFVQLTFGSPAPAAGVCTEVAQAATVVAVPALRGRPLSIDGEAPWAPVSGQEAFRHCTGPFACSPPPRNHCDPAWLTLAAHSGELQPERSYKALGCDQHWLVMNVDATVTGCQPLDGASVPAGCRATHVRWFLGFRHAHGWVVLASGGRAGCASVHEQLPAFPTALCRSLPAA